MKTELENHLASQIMSSAKFLEDLSEDLKQDGFDNYEIAFMLFKHTKRIAKDIAKVIEAKDYKID